MNKTFRKTYGQVHSLPGHSCDDDAGTLACQMQRSVDVDASVSSGINSRSPASPAKCANLAAEALSLQMELHGTSRRCSLKSTGDQSANRAKRLQQKNVCACPELNPLPEAHSCTDHQELHLLPEEHSGPASSLPTASAFGVFCRIVDTLPPRRLFATAAVIGGIVSCALLLSIQSLSQASLQQQRWPSEPDKDTGVSLLLNLAETPTPNNSSRPGSSIRKIEKTSFSGPMLVIFAGVEGSGHHATCASLAPRCGENYLAPTNPCFHLDSRAATLVQGMMHPKMTNWASLAGELQDRMDAHASMNRHVRIHIQCDSELGSPEGFKASYPDLHQADLARATNSYEGVATSCMNLVEIVHGAERAGLDVRVVLLRRKPTYSVLSRLHELKGAVDVTRIARTIKTDAAVLDSQLSAISDAFVLSLDYEEAVDQAEALEVFLRMPDSGLAASIRARWKPHIEEQDPNLVQYVQYIWDYLLPR